MSYLSARLLYRAMRILLVNEFMRRPECTVKSNVTRHSWHTALPPRKTSRRYTGLGIRHPEDVCRNISISRREREGDMHSQPVLLDTIHTSRLSLLCKQFSLCLFTRVHWYAIETCVLYFTYQFYAINFSAISSRRFLTGRARSDRQDGLKRMRLYS